MPDPITAQVTSTRHPVAAASPCSLHALLACAPVWLLVWAAPALAAETSSFGEDTLAALQEETRPLGPRAAYEIHTLVLPSLDEPAWGGSSASRPGSGGFAAPATQHVELTRWLTPESPRSLGFALGLTAAAPSASAWAHGASPGGPAATTSLDLGVRWRSRLDGGRHLDVSAWAQAPQPTQPPDAMGLIWQQQQQPMYATRVEMQWASSRTRGLVPEFGAIGVQLQGNSRLLLRARKGGPMLYYRARF